MSGEYRQLASSAPSISSRPAHEVDLRMSRPCPSLSHGGSGFAIPVPARLYRRSAESWLHLSLTTSPSAGFDLNFPFERPDAQFLEYLHLLRPHLPIRLAKSRFRHLTPTGDGTSYVRRKIEAGLFDGL